MIKTMKQIKKENKNFKFWNYQMIIAFMMFGISWLVMGFLIGLYVGVNFK